MSFIWPAMFLVLGAIPIGFIYYLKLQQRRRGIAQKFGSFGILQGENASGPGLRRHIPPALYLAGLTVLLISLARPQAVVSLPRLEGTVVLAFDVSGSMAADDLEPSRMEAAKTAALTFVERMPAQVKIGVVAFSDSSFIVQAPTTDQEEVITTILRLAPQRGTSLARGILASLETIMADEEELQQAQDNASELQRSTQIEIDRSAMIVILSDGENNMAPDPLSAARTAAEHGVRIITIGIGSQAGSILEIDGFSVHTQLDEAMLQAIAGISGGRYYNAQNEAELKEIFNEISPELVIKPEEIEVTSLFAGISTLIFLTGGMLSLLWFNRLP
jgi:Ca-activated chloride channel homolog